MERGAASPGMIGGLFLMFLEIDVRDVIPSVRVPVLLLHRRGDRAVNVRQSRRLAEHLADARLVELAGAGEVLVTRTVVDLVVGSGIAFEDRGTHELRGVPGEWQLYAVGS